MSLAVDGSRGRLLLIVGMIMFLLAATTVVVAQNVIRRPDSPIVIPAQR